MNRDWEIKEKSKNNEKININFQIKKHGLDRALTYNEKSLLFFFYVRDETDKQIARRMFSTAEAIKSKKSRIIKKIKRGVNRNVRPYNCHRR